MTRLDDLFARYPEYLSVNELCEVLGIGRATAYKWLNDGTVPAYRVRGVWKILRDDVKDLVARGSNLPTDAPPRPPDVDGG
jgi:excisionase family DNA binding protein